MRHGTLAFALLLSLGLSQAHAQTIGYNNTTTFTGSAYADGGAAVQSGNDITTLVADDIHFASGLAGQQVTGFVFSVGNLNATAVSARARVRFYGTDGTNGGPGTYLTGFTFNPITFASGVSLFNFNSATGLFAVPTNSSIWAGITFDDNTGATGITAAQLNNLGQGIFNPPTVGSSQDVFFQTAAAGSFVQNNPTGSFFNFGGSPVANFGWQFTVVTPAAPPAVPEPGCIAWLVAISMPAAGFLSRRRRKVASKAA